MLSLDGSKGEKLPTNAIHGDVILPLIANNHIFYPQIYWLVTILVRAFR